MDFDDMLDLYLHDVDVYVDVVKQKELMKRFGYWNEEANVQGVSMIRTLQRIRSNFW